MTVLCETDELELSYEYETACLKEKSTGKTLYEEGFYGDPDCGLIDSNNNWVAIGGDHLTIWTPKRVNVVEDESIKWIASMRLKSESVIEILIDPWSDDASIWEISLDTIKATKVRDFLDYKEQKYTDNVKW